MQNLRELLKLTVKFSIALAILLAGYSALSKHIKYPFVVGPSTETAQVTKVVPATATAPAKELNYTPGLPAITKAEDKKIVKPGITILPVAAPAPKKETIILGKKNTIVLRGVIDMLSVAKLQYQIMEKARNLSPSDPIYLVMDTPGGSVVAGEILIDTLRALPNKINTITLFSASMGFHTVESLDDRLILDSGTLMSHRMKVGGIEGQVPGEAVTALNYSMRLAERLDRKVSKRVGIPFDTYRSMIENELWVDGQDAVDMNLADRTVYALCGKDLNGTYEETMQVLFFKLKLTWSECPLIRFPIAVDMSDLNRAKEVFGPQMAEVKKAEYEKFIKTLIYSKEKFVKEYITTGKYKEFVSDK